MASFSLRVLTQDDAPLLALYLQMAAHEPSTESAMRNPVLARYVTGWGETEILA